MTAVRSTSGGHPSRRARDGAGGIRPLLRDDLPRIVALHGRAFPGERSRVHLERFLDNVFFGHAWLDPGVRSLGFCDRDGRIVGCLGVMPRAMQLGSRLLRIAVTHNFMVDPEHRGSLAGIALLRAAMAQGQDLTLAEGNEASRRLCESVGGTVYHERSSRWVRVVRPAALGAYLLSRRGGGHGVTNGRPPETTRPRDPGAVPEVSALLDVISLVGGQFTLRPAYGERSLGWLLGTLAQTGRPQVLRGRIVHGKRGGPVGWYLYYSRPGRVGRVLQLGALRSARYAVLGELFDDANYEGNLAVVGASDPFWTSALRRALCFPARSQSWLMGHSTHRDVHGALAAGDAFLGRLEGEGWLRLAF